MKKPTNETPYDYGASESLLTDAEYAAHPDLQMIPTVAGSAQKLIKFTTVQPYLKYDKTTVTTLFAKSID